MMKDHPSDLSDKEALDYVNDVVRRSGSSFIAALRVLKPAKRKAMFAVYAFCREVDDVADEPGEEAAKRAALVQWRQEIDRLFNGVPAHPIAMALVRPVADYGLKKQDFLDLIDGMEMDASDALRIENMEQLDLYCDRVAGAVGRLSYRIFGADEETGDLLAHNLGMALQLTNILRDLDEDAELGRLYLPADLLSQHGITETEPKSVLAHPDLEKVCRRLAEIAGKGFEDAEVILGVCDRYTMRPAIIMMEVYRRLYKRLCVRGWSGDRAPVIVSNLEKFWVAFRHGLF